MPISPARCLPSSRARRTTCASASGSAPNSIPPAFTLGQLTLISYPSSAPRAAPFSDCPSRAMTSANPPTWKPAMVAELTNTGRQGARNGGREAITRLALIAVAVAIGAALLLATLAGINAVNSQNARYAWLETGASGSNAPAVKTSAPHTDALWWLLKHHPELTDAQIARLIGTTKPTIASVRDRTHWNAANIKPQNPVTLGLCTEPDLEKAVLITMRRQKSREKAKERAERATVRAAADAAVRNPVLRPIATATYTPGSERLARSAPMNAWATNRAAEGKPGASSRSIRACSSVL